MNQSDIQRLPALHLRHRLSLAIASGIMLGASFPPSPVYSLAFVGLIPLLFLIEMLEETWRILRYCYLAFFIFHAITLYWIGGFVVGKDVWMMIAGAAVLLIHPLFYLLLILLYLWVRRRLGILIGLMFLTVAWVAYEFSHSLGEYSFPWLALGNSQAYDLPRIQIASVTSVYGISFLILAFNVIGFILIAKIATRSWRLNSRSSIASILLLLLLYFGPWVYGKIVMRTFEQDAPEKKIDVGIVQPNIDPWEKWGVTGSARWASYDRQLTNFIEQTRIVADSGVDCVIWPETAIPFRILLPEQRLYLTWLRECLDSVGMPVLTGLSYTVFYDSTSAPVTASRDAYRNRFYEDFNSTTLFIPGEGTGPVYKKIVLVPFAERIPYAESFRFLIEPLKWNVGIGMWGKGSDTVVFNLPCRVARHAKFASVICYESVYPNFVREFVRRGAQFLVVVTNDSWWGNTPGAYQHAAFASLRAVENRRWIVRAANGGISGLVDPTGTYHHATALYSRETFRGKLELRDDRTFYSNHGDLFALICTSIAALFLLLTLVPPHSRQSHDNN